MEVKGVKDVSWTEEQNINRYISEHIEDMEIILPFQHNQKKSDKGKDIMRKESNRETDKFFV